MEDLASTADNKIEANLNFGMSTAKQLHCVIQPQIMPNLLDHSLKRDLVSNHAPVVIGSLLGSVDAKIVDISNCFPMTFKMNENDQEGAKKQAAGDAEYVFDLEYLKKMLTFHKKLNDQEQILGVYISSTDIDKMCMIIVAYFRDLFMTQKVRSPLQQPIILLFDPELKNNKLDIKVSISSLFLTWKEIVKTNMVTRWSGWLKTHVLILTIFMQI